MAAEDAKNPVKGVSGPGKYAKRIDRMPSNSYGDTTETAELASGAPLAKSANAMPASDVLPKPTPVTPLYAETQRKDEPIQHGIDMGPGAGSEALSLTKPDDTNFRASFAAAKPVLAFIADLPETSPETRAVIKQLWNMQ